MASEDDDRRARRERRVWIRENHPDRGGNAETFGSGFPGSHQRRRTDLPEVRRTRPVRRALRRRLRTLARLFGRRRGKSGRVV